MNILRDILREIRLGHLLIGSFALISAFTVDASVVQNVGEPVKTIEASSVKVPVYGQLQLTIPNSPVQDQAVYLTGAGKLQKSFDTVKFDVYVGASYLDSPQGISQTNTIESIAQAGAKVVQLTALVNLKASDIKTAITSGLNANSVDIAAPAVKSALDKITFDIPKGQTVSMVGYRNSDGTETLLLEAGTQTSMTTGPDLATTFWRVWFGVPVDADMALLKGQLIGK